MPLTLPPGFSISIYAKNLSDARVILFDSAGNLWVSQPSQGIVSRLDINNGQVAKTETVFKNLNHPHGLAFDPADPNILYIAEENKISKVNVNPVGSLQKIADLPGGGEHITRTIKFGPDSRLYVSIGSTCNACVENDARRAAIYSMNKDGSDFKLFASGLRNTVFFTWSPTTGKMWGNDMGRDYLGDNLPPDEINILNAGGNYGWPYCYGKKIQDMTFNSSSNAKNICTSSEPSYIDLQAHSAPLGLDFVPENSSWPQDWWDNLIIAYHGSWNRSVPTGYKLVRVKLDKEGNYLGIEDFITGWLQGGNSLGRPVDVLFGSDGALYVSDDKAGVIYKVYYSAT